VQDERDVLDDAAHGVGAGDGGTFRADRFVHLRHP
jgi:hypothetical protein